MAFIQREDGDRGEIFAWWDGTALDASAQFNCQPHETILVLDADNGDEVLVIFVTTSPLRIEAGGALADLPDEPWVEINARVTVRDPVKAIELLPLLDDDEAPEDWLGEELILAVGHAAEEKGGDVQGLQSAAGAIAQAAANYANAVMADLGFEVAVPELSFSLSDDDE